MAGTAVWIDVLPSLKGFGSALTQGATRQAAQAGTSAGKAFSSSMNAAASTKTLNAQVQQLKQAEQEAQTTVDALTRQVDQLKTAQTRCANEIKTATRAISKARDEQKTAALNADAAEARLAETIKKHGAGTSQAIAAEARLNDARSKLRQKTEAVERAEENLRAAHSANKETSEQLATAESKLAAENDKLKNTQTRLANETGKTGKNAGTLKDRLQQWASSAKHADTQTDSLNTRTTKLADISGKAAGKIGTLAAVASTAFSKAMQTVTGSISAAVERTDLMTNFPKVMANLGYSSEDAAKSVQKISASLDGLPTTSSAMTGMVQQLAPLTSGLDEATNIALAFNNAMLAGGASTAEQENAMAQYQQMLAAGTVDMAAWRSVQAAMPGQLNQLGEALLGAGKNGNDLYAAMKNGEVSFEQFNESVVRLNAEGTGAYASFAEQAKASTEGIGTAMANMKNRVAKQIQKVIEAFGVANISNAINTFSSSFSVIGDKAAQAVKSAVGWFTQLGERIAGTGVFDRIGAAWNNLMTRFGSTDWGVLFPQSIVEAFQSAFTGSISLLGDVVAWLIDLTGNAMDEWRKFTGAIAQTGAFQTVQNVVDSLIGVWDSLYAAVQEVWGAFGSAFAQSGAASNFGQIVGSAMNMAGNAIQWACNQITRLGDWIGAHGEMVAGAIAGIAGGFAAFKAYTFIQTAVTAFKSLKGALDVATVAQWALNAAQNANPIMIVVTAIGALIGALAWFFTQTETGKQAWQTFTGWLGSAWEAVSGVLTGVWDGLCTAFEWVGGVFQGVCDAIGVAFQWLGGVFQTIGKTISHVWDSLVTVAKLCFVVVSTIVITPFQIAINLLGAAFTWLNDHVFQPVWLAIENVFIAAWQWIDQNVIQPFKIGLDLLGQAFQWLNDAIIQPVWLAIENAFIAAWQWIDQSVIQPFKMGLQLCGQVFQTLGQTFQNVWNSIENAFIVAWQWIDQNVIQPFKMGLQLCGQVFQTLGQTFQNVWNSIKNAFSASWKWIDTHVLSAFRRGLDALANAAQSMKSMVSTAFNALKDAAAKPVKWIVDVVYTNGVQKVWNGIAGAVGLGNLKLPDAAFAYADGGINPGYAPGHDTIPAMTSPGEAWMVPEWTRAVGADNIYRWNRLARQRGPQAVREDMGLAHFDNGGIAGLWNGIKSGVAGAWDWAKQKAGDIADAIGAFMKDPAAWITSKILDPVKTMLAGIGSGNWGSIVAQMPVRVVTGLIDKAKSAVSAKKATAGEGGKYTGPVGAGVEQWRPLVLQVLSELGQPASWADTVLRRMNQESGGNPNAINNWDSNAAMGDPSRGLMQTIGGTFNAYAGPYRDRGIYDPLANIYAGCAYAIARYGSLAGMNRAGGYATGGIVPTLYDRGGILPVGDSYVSNRTNTPELVLTKEQILQYFGSDTSREGARTVEMTINVPPRTDQWSQAAIWVNTAKNMIGGR